MAAEEVIFIKQLILAEDINFGVNAESQIRNGITITGTQVNSDHILFNKPGNVWHGYPLTDILDAMITQTGITPAGA
jgi:hypothetical protein